MGMSDSSLVVMALGIFAGSFPGTVSADVAANLAKDLNAGKLALVSPEPAEPVTLTAEEETSLYYQITECVGGEAWEVYGNSPQIILDWLTQHRFRLVRTGGAADGA